MWTAGLQEARKTRDQCCIIDPRRMDCYLVHREGRRKEGSLGSGLHAHLRKLPELNLMLRNTQDGAQDVLSSIFLFISSVQCI